MTFEKTKQDIIENLRAYVTIFSMIITGIYFAVTFYISITSMEAEFPILKENSIKNKREIDSLKIIVSTRNRIEEKRDSLYHERIRDLYYYKQPYGKWGNTQSTWQMRKY